MYMQQFDIGDVTFGGGELSFILGPCVVESYEHARMMSTAIKDICDRVGVKFVYKSSFDKANRRSIDSFRGQGMEFGLDFYLNITCFLSVYDKRFFSSSVFSLFFLYGIYLCFHSSIYA